MNEEPDFDPALFILSIRLAGKTWPKLWKKVPGNRIPVPVAVSFEYGAFLQRLTGFPG
jgi:hypothetical protein